MWYRGRVWSPPQRTSPRPLRPTPRLVLPQRGSVGDPVEDASASLSPLGLRGVLLVLRACRPRHPHLLLHSVTFPEASWLPRVVLSLSCRPWRPRRGDACGIAELSIDAQPRDGVSRRGTSP